MLRNKLKTPNHVSATIHASIIYFSLVRQSHVFYFEGNTCSVPLCAAYLCAFQWVACREAGVSFYPSLFVLAAHGAEVGGRSEIRFVIRSNWKPLKSFTWSRVLSVDYRVMVGFFAGWKEPPGAVRTGDIQGTSWAHTLGAEVGGKRTGWRRGCSPPDDKAGDLTDELLGERFRRRAEMILVFFPLKKLRRNGKYLLFGAILLVGAVAVYHEMVAAKSWSSDSSKFAVASPHALTTDFAQQVFVL